MNDPKLIDILINEISYKTSSGEIISYHKDITKSVEKFIKMQQQIESKQRLERQLFIGKVVCLIGFNKTRDLLQECEQIFKPQ